MEPVQKNFWDTKEGTIGIIVGVTLIAGLVYGLVHLGPILLMAFATATKLIGYGMAVVAFGAALLGLIYALFIDDGLRNYVMLRYKLLIRAMYRSVIASDPISVLREYQKKAKEKRKTVQANLESVGAQKRTTQEVYNSYEEDWKKFEREYQSAQKRGEVDLANDRLSKMGRIQAAAERTKKTLDKINMFYEQLKRAIKALDSMNENIEFDISVAERDYKTSSALNSAWGSIRQALKGQDFMDQMKDDTMSFLAEDYGRKMGEIDVWMDECETVIKGSENKDAMYADDALAALDKLNSKSFSTIEAKPVQSLSAPKTYVAVDTSSAYAKLLNK